MNLDKKQVRLTPLSFLVVLMVSACGSMPTPTQPGQVYEEVNVQTRNAEAKRVLTGSTHKILVYARGLCCPSCSLGVRKTMSRLAFVNSDAANKGIILDAKHQLVHVSVKPGTEVVTADIWQAVDDAGYDPVTIFRYTENGLETEEYTSKP